MSLKKLAGETAVYGISSILGRLLNFVLITPFVTQKEVFSEAEFGIVGVLFFYTAFFIALLVFRMDTVVFRYASRAEFSANAVCKKAQQFIWVGVAIWTIGGLLLASNIANWMDHPDWTLYIQLVVLIVAFDVLAAVPLARLRLESRPWFFAAVNLANIFVNIVLIYLLLRYIPRWMADGNTSFGWYDENIKIAYYFFAILAAGALRYLLLLGDRLLKTSKINTDALLDNSSSGLRSSNVGNETRDTAFESAPTLATMLRYAAPLVIVAVCGIINTLIGPAMLEKYFGADSEESLYWAGQYNAAMKMAVFLTLFTTAYNFAAEPFFFRNKSKDPENQDLKLYARATRAFALVCALAIAGILLLLPILQYYLGEQLREGLEVLPILMAANFMLALYYNFALAYKLTDKTYLGGWIALGGSAIVILGNVLFIPSIGIYAPAWAGLACFSFMSFCAWLVSRKYFPVPYNLGKIALYALLTCLVVFIGWPLDNLLARIGLLIGFTILLIGIEWKWLRTIR